MDNCGIFYDFGHYAFSGLKGVYIGEGTFLIGNVGVGLESVVHAIGSASGLHDIIGRGR